MPFILAYDIGGTKLEAAVLQLGAGDLQWPALDGTPRAAHVCARERSATEREHGYAHIVKRLAELGRRVLAAAQVTPQQIAAIGLSLPGSVDPATGIMLRGNTQVLEQQPLARDLCAALGIAAPVVCENDANCFALAEALAGAGAKDRARTQRTLHEQIVLGIILGTGTGGGVVAYGNVLRGARGAGTEVGHMELLTDGASCYCGRNGCAEQYLSGPGFAAQCAAVGVQGTAQEIFARAASDATAQIAVAQYRAQLGKFLGNLINAYDPDCIVLGGGMSKEAALYENLAVHIRPHCFVPSDIPPVYQHALGDSAGLFGAAMLAERIA